MEELIAALGSATSPLCTMSLRNCSQTDKQPGVGGGVGASPEHFYLGPRSAEAGMVVHRGWPWHSHYRRSSSAPPDVLSFSLSAINSFSAQNEDKSLCSRKLRLVSHSFCGAEKFSSTKHSCCRWLAICHIPSCYHLISRFCQVLGVKA